VESDGATLSRHRLGGFDLRDGGGRRVGLFDDTMVLLMLTVNDGGVRGDGRQLMMLVLIVDRLTEIQGGRGRHG
jgi:hypothetical protein